MAMTHWNVPAVLAALLDALEADLLGAPRDEAQAALRGTGWARERAVRELRALLRDAEAEGHDGRLPTRPCDGQDGMGTQRH